MDKRKLEKKLGTKLSPEQAEQYESFQLLKELYSALTDCKEHKDVKIVDVARTLIKAYGDDLKPLVEALNEEYGNNPEQDNE